MYLQLETRVLWIEKYTPFRQKYLFSHRFRGAAGAAPSLHNPLRNGLSTLFSEPGFFTTSGGDSCRVVKYLTRIRNYSGSKFLELVASAQKVKRPHRYVLASNHQLFTNFRTCFFPKRRVSRMDKVLYQILSIREPEVQKSADSPFPSGEAGLSRQNVSF